MKCEPSLPAKTALLWIGLVVVFGLANCQQQAWGVEPVVHPTGREAICSGVYRQGALGKQGFRRPVELKPGPQLFVDEALIESCVGIMRHVNVPQRDPAIPNPIVTAEGGDRCVGPYMTVLRDPIKNDFRIWYNGFTDGNIGRFATMTSEDGIRWNRSARVLKDPGPLKWGCTVIDDGPRSEDRSQRYKLAWYGNPKGNSSADGGLMIATSADGIDWKLLNDEPLMRHNHDINSLFYDPLRQRYVYTFSGQLEDSAWPGKRRTTFQCTSKDLLHWSEPWIVLMCSPEREHIETQFYSMDGFLARGELLIGMVKVLRDDLHAAEIPEGAYGMGYTTLAWSRDGKYWTRDTTPFFEPDPQAGTWDHAHAWIDEQLLVGDTLRLYYGGYKNGHKMGRTTERQLGLVTIPRDRYVAREAGSVEGTLCTVALICNGEELSVNADVKGSLQVRLLDSAGNVVPEFDYEDCRPISGDSVEHRVRWKGAMQLLKDKPVKIEFRMRDAKLFGFSADNRAR